MRGFRQASKTGKAVPKLTLMVSLAARMLVCVCVRLLLVDHLELSKKLPDICIQSQPRTQLLRDKQSKCPLNPLVKRNFTISYQYK